jgi:hypothetical protein
VGNPSEAGILCGPLHTKRAVSAFEQGVADAVSQGGHVLVGGKRLPGPGNFVEPTLIASTHAMPGKRCAAVLVMAPGHYHLGTAQLYVCGCVRAGRRQWCTGRFLRPSCM